MLRTSRLGLALGALAALTCLAPAPAADPGGEVNIAVVESMFRDTSPAMARVLARPLTNIISRKTGLTAGEVAVAPDALKLADQLKAGKSQLGVFHGFEFAWARKHNPDLVPLVVTVYPTGSPRACVVVNRENKLANLAGLNGTAVAIPRGSRGHCYLYLDGQKIAVSPTPPANAEEALSAVVQGTCPATVVDAAALIGYQKLQPGAFKQLRVLAESEQFPQNVIAYHKGGITETNAGKLREALTDAHSTAAGKPLMMLWNIVKFDDVPDDYSAQLDRVAKAYPTPVKIGVPARSSGSGGR